MAGAAAAMGWLGERGALGERRWLGRNMCFGVTEMEIRGVLG